MTPCDVAGCPREGTNEFEVKVYDQETRQVLGPGTVLVCDADFHAVHAAAVGFSLGLEPES